MCSATGSEQRDLNPRPTAPKAAALAKLRYAPIMPVDIAEFGIYLQALYLL